MTTEETKLKEYGASQITVLEGLEAVRMRPGMYIGDTSERGLHHLVYEVVDNSIDEALAGHCKNINVAIHADNSISVIDDGRGIPVDIHLKEGKPAVEVALTILHAGGKFDKDSYKVSGGLHGVGVSCVNALSEWLEVEVHREGSVHVISFERGKTKEKLRIVRPTDHTGTTVTFKPDPQIFTVLSYKWETLARRLRELAFLNRGIVITLVDERPEAAGKAETFHYQGGISEFVKHLNEGKQAITSVIYFNTEKEGMEAEVALQWNDGWTENIYTYVNNINTHEGGTHLVGFQTALTRSINAYMKTVPKLKNEPNFTGTDVREGLMAIISVKVAEPQFEGQTKTKLGNSDVRGIMESITNVELGTFLEENPQAALAIIDKAANAARVREATKRAQEQARRKSALDGMSLPGKLSDCSSKDPSKCEIYVVEGDSAGGSAKQGRDSEYQAILPIRGKLLNVEKARIDKLFANEEIKSLITAIGCGIGTEEFDITKARYHRVVIMTDADVDGSHIATLLLTFFFRQMPELIKAGYLYIAKPPLYKVKRGKREEYVESDAQLDNFLLSLGLEDVNIFTANKEPIAKEIISILIDLIKEAQILMSGLRRHGVDCNSYFAARNKETGNFPCAIVSVREINGALNTVFATSLDEESEIVSAAQTRLIEAEKALSKKPEEFIIDETIRHHNINVQNIFEVKGLKAVEDKFNAIGFSLDQLLGSETAVAIINPNTENEHPCNSIMEIFDFIRDEGKKGLQIQRYKGLGEMNPDQLWETTMDPTTRKMLKVGIEDAVAAEKMFTLLMGDEVEPRRQYIEKHADSISNLDI